MSIHKKIFGIVGLIFIVSVLISCGNGNFEKAEILIKAGKHEEALKIIRSLAEKGNPAAQFELGFSYYKGKGVPQNYKEAFKWYKKSAEQEYAKAQTGLVEMYYYGEGVAQDYVKTYKWANLAAAQNTEYVKLRDVVGKIMTRAQIAEAKKLASEFVPKHRETKTGWVNQVIFRARAIYNKQNK